MITMILLGVMLLFSAFFSATETAFISARRFKFEIWVRQKRHGAATALRLLEQPERFLTTTLVGNNIAVVSASTLMALWLNAYFGAHVITAISAVVLLVFGEILPKSLARERASIMVLRVHWFIAVVRLIFYPIIAFVLLISRWVLSLLGLESESVGRYFSRKDLEMLVREGAETGLMDTEISELIGRWLDRGRQPVHEAMLPRLDVEGIEKESPLETASLQFEKTGHSRLLVYEEDIDHIVGVLHVKDLVLLESREIAMLMKPAFYVPESLPIAQCLHQMQQANAMMAVVIDEYGGTAGIVTLEDLFEEYFGELGDGDARDSALIRKETPRIIDVHARAEIDMLNDRYDLALPEGDYQTLGGLILDRLGHIPKRGEKIELPWCKLVIFSAAHHRVQWVRVIRKKPADFSLEI